LGRCGPKGTKKGRGRPSTERGGPNQNHFCRNRKGDHVGKEPAKENQAVENTEGISEEWGKEGNIHDQKTPTLTREKKKQKPGVEITLENMCRGFLRLHNLTWGTQQNKRAKSSRRSRLHCSDPANFEWTVVKGGKERGVSRRGGGIKSLPRTVATKKQFSAYKTNNNSRKRGTKSGVKEGASIHHWGSVVRKRSQITKKGNRGQTT